LVTPRRLTARPDGSGPVSVKAAGSAIAAS
jgi:hypothetical protein